MLIRCKDIFEFISEMYDSELEEEIFNDVMEHINHCERCLALYHTFNKTVDLYRSLKPVKLPAKKKRQFHRWLHIEIRKISVRYFRR